MKCCNNFYNLKNKMQAQESWNNVMRLLRKSRMRMQSEKSGADEPLLRIVHVNCVGSVKNVNAFSHFCYNSGK